MPKRRKNCLWENYERHWKNVVTTSLRITNNALSKLIGKVFCRDHKRTRQRVLNAFLHYLYNTYVVYANLALMSIHCP